MSPTTQDENIERASRFTCYVLVNRLCFYNALRRRFPQLQRINVHNRIATGSDLEHKLKEAFEKAMRFTGDYDTVFEHDLGDEFPFLSNEAVVEWRTLIRSLDVYDFASIDLEVIGAMYERLISPEERHRYGQHYTQPAVVDLINAFAVKTGNSLVLDPACGGGTFLVRAYARKRHLEPSLDHTATLQALYGCDVLRYACHLSVINLAVRDLIDDENYPQIHAGDFLDVTPQTVFAEIPLRIVAGGLPTGTRQLSVSNSMFDAVVGNPPYIQSSRLPSARRKQYLALARAEWPTYDWSSSSDILVWFFTHSARFVREGGYLCLLTQSAWLDVDYGVELQRWILDNFCIEALLESEVEPWFTDARVATVVVILRRCESASERNANCVRFVQFKEPLARRDGNRLEAARQQLAEAQRDAILGCRKDHETSAFRVRCVRQSELAARGTNGSGRYVGSKWGRYLRTMAALYRLQNDHADAFCLLGDVASVSRGVTTNCDSFFIVSDASSEALAALQSEQAFRARYGVRRADVASGRYKIVRRDDGVEAALDDSALRPTLKTARNVDARSTSLVRASSYMVCLRGPRSALSALERRYVEAGEREHWHESPSFNGRDDWFVLRDAVSAPILFVKTIQYTPQLLWNDSGVIANQRLYNVSPSDGTDAEVLASILNSTIFAAERFSAVKALGREAANDVEVFTARQFRLPNPRRLTPRMSDPIKAAFGRMRTRDAQPLLESALINAGLHEAKSYAHRTPIAPDVWPEELRDPDRQLIDELLLQALGYTPEAATKKRMELYNDVMRFVRRARLLELEAQVNRRGTSATGASANQLADDVWSELMTAHSVSPRHLATHFTPTGVPMEIYTLPGGRVAPQDFDLFSDANEQNLLRFGKASLIGFSSRAQRDLALLLAEHRVRGEVSLPRDPSVCDSVRAAIAAYLDEVLPKLRLVAAEITENLELQDRIVNEATKRLATHR